MHKAHCFMLQVIRLATMLQMVDDVANGRYMLVTFYKLVLQLSICCSTCSVWTLICDWLGYFRSSLPYPHMCESYDHLYLISTSAFSQWGQIIVLLTYRIRETSPSQIVSSSHVITISSVIGSRSICCILAGSEKYLQQYYKF